MSLFANRIDAARNQTDTLFNALDPRALYHRPVAERHRLIFYLGHLEAFDWNLLHERAMNSPSFHPAFDKLFAFGIDPDPGGVPMDQPTDWPSENEVREYAARVRERIDGALDRVPDELLNVAIEHRLMHAETLAYLIHNLPYRSKRGPAPDAPADHSFPPNPLIDVPAGPVTLGKPRGNGFGWDNEFERHSLDVPAFRISKFKISNGEYLDFVHAGAAPPHFWFKRDGSWFLRGMFSEISLPLSWPVYVTHREAAAYAAARGGSLPTEPQLQRASEGALPVNADFAAWDPVPVNTNGGTSLFGVEQTVGNGWEWTSSLFAPFPGFEPFPFYPGYSADFFDSKHYVMKGGSPRTAECLLRPTFRNWFRPDYPHVYAGFRIVENAE